MGEPLASSAGDQLRTLARARASSDREDWEQAVRLWAEVVAANPVDGSHWFHLAQARRHRQDLDGAIAAYEKALELRHGYPAETAYMIAGCHAQLGQSEAALDRLDQALRLGLRDVAPARTEEDFAALRDNPRFRELVGLVDLDGISRDGGWRLDLGILAREVKRRAYKPFRLVSEERFDTEVKRIDAAIPELTDMQVITEMRRLLALLGDGHASIQPPPDRPDLLKALPVVLYLFEEGLFVAGAEADRRDLVGAQVLEIGEVTAERALDAVRPLIARDNEHWPREVGPLLLRLGPLLDALDISSNPERIALKIVRLDGDSEVIELRADSDLIRMGQALPRPPGYLLLPDMLDGPPPLYLRNADLSYWFEHLRDEGLVYCQINRVLDEPGEGFQEFTGRLMDHVDAVSPNRLVIDLRWNPGGNTHLVLPFLHRVIGSPANRRGRLFVIIGRRTSSAAMNLTALLDRHTEAIFVGEPTGSSPTFIGETIPFELPYSHVRANVSDLLWQSSWPMDYRTWVPPTIYAPPTFELYRSGRDPALEAILSTKEHLPGS
jgi:tetratricopeptide repeat protein